ncbi:specific transcriptional repressor [Gigaspora margarita]|uniref:Specific transcriptional repressor n=1 Tax=Gigaspora margarita TaxID=4874 RepID=A0A8H4EKV0_GIGMA|nr:specific transcriptional repressor [Gigaspora margarita]
MPKSYKYMFQIKAWPISFLVLESSDKQDIFLCAYPSLTAQESQSSGELPQVVSSILQMSNEKPSHESFSFLAVSFLRKNLDEIKEIYSVAYAVTKTMDFFRNFVAIRVLLGGEISSSTSKVNRYGDDT